MRDHIRKILLFLNYVSIAALLLSYLSVYVSPVKFWPFAFLGLIYPYLLMINVAFLILWLFTGKKMFFVTLVVILIGWNNIKNHVQFSLFGHRKADTATSFSLASYNVRIFNYYNWTHNRQSQDDMLNLIDSLEPQIICLQEFLVKKQGSFTETDVLSSLYRTRYAHIYYNGSMAKNTVRYGIATLSAFPIVHRGEIVFKRSLNACIYTDIAVHGDTIRVYNNHLQSVKFEQKNYNYMDSVNLLDYDEEHVNALRNISEKLRTAYKVRAKQADVIAAHIKSSPYPVIVCGDFNDTPVSYTYHTMKHGLRDAFASSGSGFGHTYIGKFPSLRIDYILYSKKFRPYDYSIHKAFHSDHFPVFCRFAIKK